LGRFDRCRPRPKSGTARRWHFGVHHARPRHGPDAPSELGCERYVYVVADEQNYHFQVLFETLKRLGEPYAAGLHHLSYGLVELPTGRMKTREGTVVDADDLITEVIRIATEQSKDRGEAETLSEAENGKICAGWAWAP
jgi:arginyl-tRNA synthetase